MSSVPVSKIAQKIHSTVKNKSGDNLDKTLASIVSILSKNKLLGKPNAVLEKLEHLLDKENGIIRAKVYTARKMSLESINEIEKELKNKYKTKNIYITVIEDPKILGGIKIQIGDETIDLSLQKKVTQLKKHLLN